MQPNTLVKFKEPQDDDEALTVFRVVEDRESRILVELVCDLPIRPTFVYNTAELECIE